MIGTLPAVPWRRLVDLTLPIRPHVKWTVRAERLKAFERGDHSQASAFWMSAHSFTHIDAPRHFVPDGTTIDRIPIEQLSGPAAVVDCSHMGAADEISGAVLEERAAHVRPGDIVLLRTDWDTRCSWETEAFWTTAPYLGASGAEWLVARQAKAVGYDFPQDWVIRDMGRREPAREEFVVHVAFLPRGILNIEYLTNLAAIGSPRCYVLALPIPLEGGDGAPARVVALIP